MGVALCLIPLQFADSLEVSHESVDSDLSSSFSLDSRDHAPRDHTPKKLHQFPPKEVAKELTLMDSELLRNIRPEELKDGAWIKKETKVRTMSACTCACTCCN